MKAERQVGVLLPSAVLRRAITSKPTYESVIEYALAAERMNMEAVLFCPQGYGPRDRHIRGFVWREGRWVRWRGALPRVVYNRLLSSAKTKHILRSLMKELGPGLFNPLVSRDKWKVWRQLAADKAIRPHLPPTRLLDRALCQHLAKTVKHGRGVVIKPCRGSLGDGILFIRPVRTVGNRYVYRITPDKGSPRTVSKATLIGIAHARRRRRKHIVQTTIPLMKFEGRRCDVRVPVQRNVAGDWTVVAPTIKQAGRHGYLTNIAQGGRALSFHSVIEAVFGFDRVHGIEGEVHDLSMAVANRLTALNPQIADVGLDLGIDVDGKPWLIEVNFRDLRLVSRSAGEHRTHTQQYHNPMYYAAHLMDEIARGRSSRRGGSL